MKSSQLVDLFQRARNDRSLAVVEGVQALKHAVRFKADIQLYITCDIAMLNNLLDELAEDVKDAVEGATDAIKDKLKWFSNRH